MGCCCADLASSKHPDVASAAPGLTAVQLRGALLEKDPCNKVVGGWGGGMKTCVAGCV